MMEDNQEIENRDLIIRRATFGKQVDIFMSSDIGRYMINRAAEESRSAFEEFKKCDSSNINNVQRLQNKILRSENIQQWLEDAVIDGLHAIKIMEDRE